MKLSLPLTLPPHCYAGPLRVNVYDLTKDTHAVPSVYLEFQEGCGYNPRMLTPDEARTIANALLEAAEASEKSFGIAAKTSEPKEKFKVVVTEYERGWSPKSDEPVEFDTEAEARAYVNKINSKNTAASAPDWYMVARLVEKK